VAAANSTGKDDEMRFPSRRNHSTNCASAAKHFVVWVRGDDQKAITIWHSFSARETPRYRVGEYMVDSMVASPAPAPICH
jgi:hypothetical protein